MPEPTSLPLASFETLGDLLKFLRRRARLSQRDLSIAVGYSESQISRLEGNIRAPDPTTLAALFVQALHIENEPETVARLLELGARAHAEAPAEPAPDDSTLQPRSPEAVLAGLAEAKPGPAARHNLPLQLTNFIGRAQEIEAVKRLLRSSRLLTLTGLGGAGKTRLAIAVAAEVLAEVPDGVWLVELARISEPALVPQATATALALRSAAGLADEAGPAARSSGDALSLVVEHLRDKSLLLILDNCEHLVQASAEFAEQLLRIAPRLTILATSREALGVVGENSYPVPALTVPDPRQHQSLESLAHSEAMQLFVARARAVRPDFALTDQNAPAVVQICRQLDGVPLAIELAAARARALSAEEIAARLDNRLALLAGGSRTAAPRQQTLRGAIDWSYDLLSDAERSLLRQMSVFAGGWTLEAAEHVAGQPEVLDLLTHLVTKSLVQSIQQPGQETRFQMLETIREYAQEKLAQAGEVAATQARHLAFYLALAEEADPELRRHGQAIWLKRLDRENDNLRAALTRALKGDEAELVLRLAGALSYFWKILDYGVEGCRWLEAALQLNSKHNSLGPSAGRARALVGAVWLSQGSNFGVSRPRLEQALAIYRELRDTAGLAFAVWLMAMELWSVKQLADAQTHFDEALGLAMAAEDGWAVGLCLHFMGHVAEDKGDRAQAHELYQRSIDVFREEGDRWQITQINHVNLQLWQDGDIGRARAMIEADLAAAEVLGSSWAICAALNLSNLVYLALGDYTQASAAALTILNLPGTRRFQASGYTRLGQIDYLQGRLPEARAHFEAGLKIFRELDDANELSWVPPWLGCVAYRSGDLERARLLIEEGLAIDDPSVFWVEVAFALLARGDVARAQGQPKTAAEYYARSLKLVLEYRDQPDVAERLEGFAKLAGAAGQPQRAARLFGAAEALRDRIGTPVPPVERSDYDAAVAQARAQLDPEVFGAAWDEGLAMNWEQAAAYALEIKAS